MIFLDWIAAAGSSIFPPFLGSSGDAGSFVGGAADQEHLCRHANPASLNVTSLSINLYDVPAATITDFRLTLRSDNAGEPGTLLAVTATVNEGSYSAGETVTLAVTPVTIVAGDYWLGVHMDGAVETEAKAASCLERGRCADTFSDGTSVSPGAYTDLSSTTALMIWANGTPA